MGTQHLRLGDMIEALEAQPPEHHVYYDFGSFSPDGIDSFRGYYHELALGYTEVPYADTMRVARLLGLCKSALGARFNGYKGGDYYMDRDTRLWVANYGHSSSTAVANVLNTGHSTVIETRYED